MICRLAPTSGVILSCWVRAWDRILFRYLHVNGKTFTSDQELLRLGVPITMPQRQINGIRLTAHEYHRYVVLAGNEAKNPSTGLGLKDTIDKLVDGTHPLSSAYNRASDGPDGNKAKYIRGLLQIFGNRPRSS